jgi:hypothetical protein
MTDNQSTSKKSKRILFGDRFPDPIERVVQSPTHDADRRLAARTADKYITREGVVLKNGGRS